MVMRDLHAAFEQQLHQHRAIVLKVAASYAFDREDRHELAQDIHVQLWRSRHRFDATQAKFSTWMYRVALNVAISWLRHRQHQGLDHAESLQPHHIEVLAGSESPESDAEVAELMGFVHRLEPLSRALLLLYLDDRSYAQIAEVLGISETSVATRISRIKTTLRRRMIPSTSAEDV